MITLFIKSIGSFTNGFLKSFERCLSVLAENAVNAMLANTEALCLKRFLKLLDLIAARAIRKIAKIFLKRVGLSNQLSAFGAYNLKSAGQISQIRAQLFYLRRKVQKIVGGSLRENIMECFANGLDHCPKRSQSIGNALNQICSSAGILPCLKNLIPLIGSGSKYFPKGIRQIRPENARLIVITKDQLEGLHPAGAYSVGSCINRFFERFCFLSGFCSFVIGFVVFVGK